MWVDPIVEEIHQIREAYAAQFNYDIEAMCRDIKRQEQESGREFVTLPLNRSQEASTSDEAFTIADRKGQAETEVSNHTYNNRPAVWIYAGVRKLNECIEHFDPEAIAPGGMEEHGTEVTYSSFILSDEIALQRLLDDRDVTVLYEGIEPEETKESPSADPLEGGEK